MILIHPKEILDELREMEHNIWENRKTFLVYGSENRKETFNSIYLTDTLKKYYNLPRYIIGITWYEFNVVMESGERNMDGRVEFNEDCTARIYYEIKDKIGYIIYLCNHHFNRLKNYIAIQRLKLNI
jgi:hypothetical protein